MYMKLLIDLPVQMRKIENERYAVTRRGGINASSIQTRLRALFKDFCALELKTNATNKL
jgi:hypothetical protein